MIAAFALSVIFAVIPPAPTHFVTDSAHVLSSVTAADLETELRDFQRATGHEVIVWISQSTDGVPLESFTVDAAEKWKAGRKGKDDGAVLFVFMRDHRVRIEVGYGLESTLTDAKSADIISTIVTPRMRSGDIDGAVSGAVDKMLSTIDPSRVSPSAEPTGGSSDSDDTMGAIVFMLIILVVGGGLLTGLIVTIARRGKRKGDWLDNFMFVSPPGYRGTGGGFLGGGGFGGGGFSGGGGGFGGGGASGGW